MAIPVVVTGLGPVGLSIAQRAVQSDELDLVAALEIKPDLVGRHLTDLIVGAKTDVTVTSDPYTAFAQARNGILLQATASRLPDVVPQVLSAVDAGLSVVSTCPELSYPWLTDVETAQMLDKIAGQKQKAILGAGVNPGFALDRLVACAGLVSGNVRHVQAKRGVDISNRRPALLRKAGVGLSRSEFRAQVSSGSVGHTGLIQSAVLAALGLGLCYDEIKEDLQPVISDKAWAGPIPIQPGQTAGYKQTAQLFQHDRELIHLDLTYAVDTINHDSVLIDADPKIDLVIQGGVSGDAATSWSVLNAVPRVMRAGFGLLTILDLPIGPTSRQPSL